MVSRTELERLIVLGLDELRRAEVDLENRFRIGSRHGSCSSFANSLGQLKAQAARLEVLLSALDKNESTGTPLAA